MKDKKYWVPAIEKAHDVIMLIGAEPGRYGLSDISKILNISKSSLFSLLNTMDELGWILRDSKETFSLGLHFGMMGNLFFERYDIIDLFQHEASKTMELLNESIQLARLEGSDVFYLAKKTSPAPVQMISSPGARLPAHATGLGKVMLAGLKDDVFHALYPDGELQQLTENTISTKKELYKEITKIRTQGYAYDLQEGVMGFNCIASPIYLQNGQIAAVSVSMPVHVWEEKKERSLKEIMKLAQRLTLKSK